LRKISTCRFHPVINGIKQISPKHAYFVNDKQIDGSQYLLAVTIHRMFPGKYVGGINISSRIKIFLHIAIWNKHPKRQ
jgi:hypothetical protein